MGRPDQPTLEFMREVAGQQTAPAEAHTALDQLRSARAVVKAIQDPRRAIGKALVSKTVKDFAKEGGVSPLRLYALLNESHGREWWDWEPETIWTTFQKEHGVEASDELRNLVMAIQLTLNSNAPFEHWHVFEKVGHAFNLNPVNFAIVQPLEPDEAALTIKTLCRIRPKQDFELEVHSYIAACARNAGMVYLPPELYLPDCQGALDKMRFGGDDLVARVTKAWGAGQKGDDFPTQIQVGRLQEVKDYLRAAEAGYGDFADA